MSAASLLRCITRPAGCSRHVSLGSRSLSQKSKKAGPALPKNKMRALVSLYHEADSFIAPHRLLSEIDAAFLPFDSVYNARTEEEPYKTIESQARQRRALPKIGQSTVVAPVSEQQGRDWSEQRSGPERMIIEALYGVDGRGLPGLEALEEEHERIQEHLRRDRTAQQRIAAGREAEQVLPLKRLLDAHLVRLVVFVAHSGMLSGITIATG
ncbi:uncharacterized protein FIBRA_04939 [Fibroporia radiculosa]|uniref:Uncharacterized protein n=1 Tax=Fibroporia radiculosa TaxID=599839 RepID=J4HWT6_9APHY|nr:uncharacterized protein FIBRA_04939 [Fibroporia radiculosa]CCM02827.1 predicted protein [Fibroporia radiculosa]